MGSDPDLFRRSDFDEHLKKFGLWTVYISIETFPLLFAESGDVSNMDDFCENLNKDDQSDLIHEFDAATQLIYAKRIKDLVGDMYDLRYHAK